MRANFYLSFKTFFNIFFLIFFTSLIYAQESSYKISLDQQIKASNLVIEGKVIDKKAYWDINKKMIYTLNTIEVYKVFKGSSEGYIAILTEGGFIDDEGLEASHSLKLSIGAVGVFNLFEDNTDLKDKASKHKQYKVYSSQQGFYEYDLNYNYVTNPFFKMDGIENNFYKKVTSLTKKSFLEISKNKLFIKKRLTNKSNISTPSEIRFMPTTISAGTKSVLKITGEGFGTSRGTIGFKNADNGGASFLNVLDSEIINWTDTQIEVEVNKDAGTGEIRITTANNETVTSTAILTIIYSQSNTTNSSNQTFQVQHFNQNNQGGLTFQLRKDIFDDISFPGAKAAFERAIDTWRCETKINWIIDGNPTNGTRTTDNLNLIAFDGNGIDQERVGRLATTYTKYLGRSCSGKTIWAVTDIDIIFDSDRDWNFTQNATLKTGQFDFETVALHELGHAHQLGHVIDPNNLMHFSSRSKFVQLKPDSNSILGAKDVQLRSTTNAICSGNPNRPLMIAFSRSCDTLSVLDIDTNKNDLYIYPNPATNLINISNTKNVNLYKITLFNSQGVKALEQELNTNIKTVNIENLPKGLYIINLESDEKIFENKLIIN